MVNYSLPYMKQGGKIMNIVSCSAFQPLPYINMYASTKSFLLSYSRALNRELAYRKIHVLAVCPFWVRTEFFDRAIDPDEKRTVIHYGAIYGPEAVIRKAIKDLFSKKDISAYGLLNKLQILSVKLVPHKYVMDIWMMQQKLDGTPNIRK